MARFFDQLGKQGARLASGCLNAPLHCHIRLHHHHALLQCHRADEIQEKTFPATKPPQHDAESRAALLDAVQVGERGGYFILRPT